MGELLTALATGSDDSLFEELRREYIDNRILVINEDITDCIIDDYITYILKWNRDDLDVPAEKRKKIKLYINSAGGDAIAAFNLIDVIMQSKTPIMGVGMSLVASAAYYIFIACHDRVTFRNTILLQHDGTVNIQNSGNKAKDTMRFIEDMDRRTKQFVLDHTKISSEFYDEKDDQEYYMFPQEAKELGCIDKIIGENCDIDYIL